MDKRKSNHAEMFNHPDHLDLMRFANFVSGNARMQREGFFATGKLIFHALCDYFLAKECRLHTVIVVSDCPRSMFKRSKF